MSIEKLRDITLRLIDQCTSLEELELIRLWVFAKHK